MADGNRSTDGMIKEIHDDVKAMSEKLATVDKNVALNTQTIGILVARVNSKSKYLDDHEKRIGTIETSRATTAKNLKLFVWLPSGLATAFGAIYGGWIAFKEFLKGMGSN